MTTTDINARAHARERDADSFNYAGLADGLAEKMQEAASDIRRYARDAYVEVGKQLLEIKDGLEQGQYKMWVENACYLKIRTAERAMQMAELVEKNVNLTYLPQQALLLLASRSASKRLRDAIIRSIDAGERPAAAEIE